MLLKLSPKRFVALEHVVSISEKGSSVDFTFFSILTADGEEHRVGGVEAEHLKFFLNEMSAGIIVDLAAMYEKREHILEIKAKMKEKLAEIEKLEAAKKGNIQGGATEVNPLFMNTNLMGGKPAILRGSDGQPLKNLIVMPPKKGGQGNGGNSNSAA